MNKKLLLPILGATAVIAFSAFTVMYPTGMAKKTGSPADGGDCENCHGGGATTPGLAFTSSPSFGAGSTYTPNTTYTITLTGSGYNKYGLDFEVLNSQSATASTVGNFGTLSTGGNAGITLNGPTATKPYSDVMHNTPSTSGVFKLVWTAPASGTGYLYCALLGCNGQGNTAGDKVNLLSLTLKEGTNSIPESSAANNPTSLWPNLGTGQFLLNSALNNYSIEVYNVLGNLVKKENGLSGSYTLNLEGEESGYYEIKIIGQNNEVYFERLIKQ